MAITVATTTWDLRPIGEPTYITRTLVAGATGKMYAGTIAMAVVGTGTLRYADDTASAVLIGFVADTPSAVQAGNNPATGDKAKVLLPGCLVWLPDTTDTLDDTIIGETVYVDDGGNAQKVEKTDGNINLKGIVGRVIDYDTSRSAVLLDTRFFGMLDAGVEL